MSWKPFIRHYYILWDLYAAIQHGICSKKSIQVGSNDLTKYMPKQQMPSKSHDISRTQKLRNPK